MNIKPIKAFAIVKKNKPKLSAFEIYTEKDVVLNTGEVIIEVIIQPVVKK